jgi:hypothetical protein
MTLSFYQCYHILMAAKKGLNVGNIIYGHKHFFSAKIYSFVACYYHFTREQDESNTDAPDIHTNTS